MQLGVVAEAGNSGMRRLRQGAWAIHKNSPLRKGARQGKPFLEEPEVTFVTCPVQAPGLHLGCAGWLHILERGHVTSTDLGTSVLSFFRAKAQKPSKLSGLINFVFLCICTYICIIHVPMYDVCEDAHM